MRGQQCSLEGVLDGEGHLVAVPEGEALVGPEAIVVGKEQAPDTGGPAGVEATGGVEVDEPVPNVGDEVFEESHN